MQRALTFVLGGSVLLAASHGCLIERTRDEGDALHPVDFADPLSPQFHGTFLATHGYPLAECRQCHGDDYAGGNVGSSCVSAGCHDDEGGVEACGTCHLPEPDTGAHEAHFDQGASCESCHPLRLDARDLAHPGGSIDVQFTGLATAAGASPQWDPAERSCSDVYCHGQRAPDWDDPGPLGCDGCHDAPPAWHAQFADKQTDCAPCHADSDAHVDGVFDNAPLDCASCHGKGPLGAPPTDLEGSSTSAAVGAHIRHLDPTLSDRIGRVAKCSDCHEVPDEILAPGHIDAMAPADVILDGDESYDAATMGCVVGCHFSRDPGPQWDDTNAAVTACDGCHAFPPLVTRIGTAHPPAPPDLQVCLSCHLFDPAIHVDGTVDFAW